MNSSIDPMSASLSLRDAIHDFGAHVVAPPNNSPTTGRQLRDRCQGRIGPWVIHTPIKGDKIEACNCPRREILVTRAVLSGVHPLDERQAPPSQCRSAGDGLRDVISEGVSWWRGQRWRHPR